MLEECNHATDWVSRGMFVPKGVESGEKLHARLVSNLRGINKKLKGSLYPKEGSKALLKG